MEYLKEKLSSYLQSSLPEMKATKATDVTNNKH